MQDNKREETRILLVDDDEDLRELFTEVLTSQGYSVEAAIGAAQALEILAAVPISLLISDYSMPDKTGGRLIQEVRRLYPGKPTMLISANMHVAQLAKLAGADRYFLKGQPLAIFLRSVRELCGTD